VDDNPVKIVLGHCLVEDGRAGGQDALVDEAFSDPCKVLQNVGRHEHIVFSDNAEIGTIGEGTLHDLPRVAEHTKVAGVKPDRKTPTMCDNEHLGLDAAWLERDPRIPIVKTAYLGPVVDDLAEVVRPITSHEDELKLHT
jgi:hypothetical protein